VITPGAFFICACQLFDNNDFNFYKYFHSCFLLSLLFMRGEGGWVFFVRRIAQVVRKLDKVGVVVAKHCSCWSAAPTLFWGGHPTVGFRNRQNRPKLNLTFTRNVKI
jgi:hypothetical protein